jgi:uncharacterized protein (TIGR02996 family)
MSTERAALIQAILRAPDDDQPRLVCADWFEEQGGEADVARAEFIRSQVLRARLPEGDPRRRELFAREMRLLRRHRAAWQGSHFAFRKSRFRRGFVERVHLHLQTFQHHRRQMFALEPVRDISLTGFWRARPELVRRVAACAEWRHVQTLRIHCQGPHHWPLGTMLDLLESPHLAGLRRVRCPAANFDADCRRRFERLFARGGVADVQVPLLEPWPDNPGEWLSDPGPSPAGTGEGLRALRLPEHLDLNTLRRFAGAPYWDRLTALDAAVFNAEGLALLRERLPAGLRRLNVQVSGRYEEMRADTLFERLAVVPLEVLQVDGPAIGPEALGLLLGGTGSCTLRQLRLSGGRCGMRQAAAIADSPGSRHLRSLAVNLDGPSGEAIVRRFAESAHLNGLVSLVMQTTGDGSGSLRALASAGRWHSLRSLVVACDGFGPEALQTFLGSPAARGLNYLGLGAFRERVEIAPDVAEAITRLPHLAVLCLQVHSLPQRAREILTTSASVAWPHLIVETGLPGEESGPLLPPVDDTSGWESDED